MFDGTLSTVLDGEGNGEIRLAFPGQSVTIYRLTVATSPATREVLCSVFRNFVGPPYLVDNTYTGGTGDTSDTSHSLKDGSALIVRWEGGDPGARATVTYSGE